MSKQCHVYLDGYDAPFPVPANRVQLRSGPGGELVAYQLYDERDELIMLVPADRLTAVVLLP